MKYIQFYDIEYDALFNVPVEDDKVHSIDPTYVVFDVSDPKYPTASLDKTVKIIEHLQRYKERYGRTTQYMFSETALDIL